MFDGVKSRHDTLGQYGTEELKWHQGDADVLNLYLSFSSEIMHCDNGMAGEVYFSVVTAVVVRISMSRYLGNCFWEYGERVAANKKRIGWNC